MHNEIDPGFKEVEVPSMHETFEAQILTITAPRKETRYAYSGIDYVTPIVSACANETRRIISSGHYRIELVEPAYAGGKPTLIIREDADEQA